MTQIFISYSRKDISFVEKMAGDLKNAGLEVWYDVSGLAGGAHWRREIENAINNSQFIVVVLSPDSIESDWVEREFLFASNRKRPIIPLLYRACELPMNYLNLNYIDVQGNKYRENFDELLQALRIEPDPGIVPPSRKPAFSLKTGLIAAFVLLLGTLMAVLLPKISNNTPPVVVTISQTSRPPSEPSPTRETPQASPIPVAISSVTPAPNPAEISDLDPSGNPIAMRLVPEGEFTMGSKIGEPDEAPVHNVYLDAFYMDTYEVTNALYEACVSAGVCDPPHQVNSYSHSSYYGNSEFDNYPVVYVDWSQAKAYCEWRSADLPTEAQWEKAARGTDGRVYPWGEGINCERASYGGCQSDIDGVGSYESGISPFGLYDMAGNVWEWVSDWYSETYYRNSPASNPLGPDGGTHRVLRGGTWDSPDHNLHTSRRLKYKPAFYTEGIGFRCSRDANP